MKRTRLTILTAASGGYLDFLIASGNPARAFKQRGIEHVKRVTFIIVNAETKQSTRYWSLLKETPGLDNIGDVSFLRHD